MSFLALTLLALQQAAESARAFVELAAERHAALVQQPLRLTVRFGVEKEYLRHNLLQLFTRPLDVPVQLLFAWPAGRPDSPELGPTFALGEEIVRPTRWREEQRAGTPWVVLELEREIVPDTPGRLEIPAPVLHFAYASRFGDDLVSGAVPLDRQEGRVSCAPLVLEVAPFPAEGRPAGFVDAVGKFTLGLEVEPRALAAGGKLTLLLTIEGQGNLARLAPPRLDRLPGLHLLGTTEKLEDGRRTLRCEFVVESPRTREVPALELDFFDPEARAYRSARTQPIALQVAAPAPAGGAGFPAFGSAIVFGGLVLLLALGLGVWKWLTGRRERR